MFGDMVVGVKQSCSSCVCVCVGVGDYIKSSIVTLILQYDS